VLLTSAPVSISRLITAITSHFLFRTPRSDQAGFIKDALGRLGRSLGYRVSSPEAGRHPSPREWLLDVVWWQPGAGTMMAANWEWGNAGDIMHSFEKLMSVKAPLKLMVFGTRQAGAERPDILLRTDSDAILQALGAALIDFSQHLEGETYLLLEYMEDTSAFRAYDFRVPGDGRLAATFEDAKALFRHVEVVSLTAA
jgi:hypothetical protein